MNSKSSPDSSPAGPSCSTEPHLPLPRTAFSQAAFSRAAALFRALGDAERLKLLETLAHREVCVTELSEISGYNISTVSQRLRILRTEGLVVHRREGKHIFYALTDQHIVELVRNALDHVSESTGAKRDPT